MVISPQMKENMILHFFEEIENVKHKCMNPYSFRDHIRKIYNKFYENGFLENRKHMLLLFGSVARCEDSKDVDLILVLDEFEGFHRYERISLERISFDFNVVSHKWLKNANSDVEWGLCLSESFIVGTNSDNLEDSWRKSLQDYMKHDAQISRMELHKSFYLELRDAYRRLSSTTASYVTRFIAHEAVRCACSGMIELYGKRIFSHRTFISEIQNCLDRAGVDKEKSSIIIEGLKVFSNGKSQGDEYIALRTSLSKFIRESDKHKFYTYDPSDRKEIKVHKLSEISVVENLDEGDRILQLYCSDSVLPSKDKLEKAISLVGDILACSISKVRSCWEYQKEQKQFFINTISKENFPSMSSFYGARWVDFKENRLKVILSTGGCKTASCNFCYLPYFAKQLPKAEPADVLAKTIDKYKPHAIAVYNDGSILNPSEINSQKFDKILRIIKLGNITSLTFESVPRFVNKSILKKIISESGVKTFQLAMGMQCLGDWLAVKRLGRPDCDVVYERAIDLIHDAGAKTRVYLMWGLPLYSNISQSSLLVESVEWLKERNVNLITICPYVAPVDAKHNDVASGSSLCELVKCVNDLPVDFKNIIKFSFYEVPSCGMSYIGQGCESCYVTLKSNFSEYRPCEKL
ncbi:hypothetical protein [Maridesulfovibrio sp. FT414]|uniref:hypothetical protein n=1 Tax=Maridesulfovibrio sp. FT414 TaxID=2979469 RepID=UPI003D803693